MKLFVLIPLLFLPVLLFAQTVTNGTIRGFILEKNTGEAVVFATVILRKDTLVRKASSDINGFYSFTGLTTGIYQLTVTSGDFPKGYIGTVVLGSKPIAEHTVYLNPEPQPLEEIVLMAPPPVESRSGIIGNMGSSSTRFAFSGEARYNIGGRGNGLGADNSESYDDFSENGLKVVQSAPLSTFSIDVDKAAYSNIRRFINKGSLPPPDAVRIEEMINYFTYDYPAPEGNNPVSITTAYTNCPWNTKRNLLYIGVQGKTIDLQRAPANNLVFLIDVSGSMQSSDKLELLKSGLYLLVEQLREQDKVSIVVYAGSAGVVLSPTSGHDKEKIKCVIEELQAGGSTAGGAGIELAYKLAKEHFIAGGNNRVILATDGDFNVGINDEGALVRLIEEKRSTGIYLSVLGFGTGNLKDSKMEKLADHGNGNYAYIDNLSEAKKVLVSEMGGTLITTAKDVKLQVEFNPANVKAYRLVGYENRMLQNEDFNNDQKDAGELGSGHSVTAVYEIIPAGSDESIPAIDTLKYQQALVPAGNTGAQSDIATVKLRYKEPSDSTSKLMSHVTRNELQSLASANSRYRFVAAVIEFGLLLRASEYKAAASFEQVLSLSEGTIGQDAARKEFVELVTKASQLKK